MHKVMHSYALLTQPDRIILRSASNFFLSGGKEKKNVNSAWMEGENFFTLSSLPS